MKKRTKITLRTKIYLTMVGLLTLTGVFYAATPTSFAPLLEGPQVWPLPRLILRDPMVQPKFQCRIDCHGHVTVVATDSGLGNQQCIEKYLAIAPRQSVMRTGRVHPADVFITEGQNIYKYSSREVSSRPLRGRVPLLGPQLDYVRPCGHIWQQHDRSVRERPHLDG